MRSGILYVHHIKQERSFRDTLTLHVQTFEDAGKVVWLKKNEIRFNNRMFDIKHQARNTDSVILVGHYDDFEHELYKSLQKLFDDDGDAPLQQQNNSLLSIVAITPPGQLICFYSSIEVDEAQFNRWHNLFFYSINIPPPSYPPDNIV